MRLAVLAVPAFLFMSVPIARADPPDNDEVAGATVVPDLGYSDSVDTTEATTGSQDPDCYGNANTVWYSFTPKDDVRVLVTAFGSDHDVTLSVYTDPPDGGITCNVVSGAQGGILFDASTTETYYVMAGSPWWGSPGNLEIQFDEAPPPLDVEITLASKAIVDPKSGQVAVSGAMYCSRAASGDVCGDLKQKLLGHLALAGGFCMYVECPGEGTFDWQATASSDGGYFKGGKANLWANTCMCDDYECDCDEDKHVIQLSGGK